MTPRSRYAVPYTVLTANILCRRLPGRAETLFGTGPVDHETRRMPETRLDDLLEFTWSLMDLDLPSDRKVHEHRLYVALTVAFAIYHVCGSNEDARKVWGHKLLADHGVKRSRRNSSEAVPFAKLVLPGREARDYSKYGRAIDNASRTNLTPRQFYKHLKKGGGIAGFNKAHEYKNNS